MTPDRISGAEPAFARAHDRCQVRRRSAGGEDAARRRRELHPVAQPVERIRLELHERGRGTPHARVTVDAVRDQVGKRGRKYPAARNEREVAGARGVVAARDPLVEERLEQRIERRAPLRRRLAKGATELGGIHVTTDGLLLDGREMRDDAAQYRIPHRMHLRGRKLQIGLISAGLHRVNNTHSRLRTLCDGSTCIFRRRE